MTQPIRYDQQELENTAYPRRLLSVEQGTETGRWQDVPHRLVVDNLFSTHYRGKIRFEPFPGGRPVLTTLQSQLEELSRLESGWNGYGAELPNERALSDAAEALYILNDLDFLPSRIVASADGGVSLVFPLSGGGYVDIECFNEGDILAGFQLPGHPPEIEEVALDKESLSELSERIRHLGYA